MREHDMIRTKIERAADALNKLNNNIGPYKPDLPRKPQWKWKWWEFSHVSETILKLENEKTRTYGSANQASDLMKDIRTPKDLAALIVLLDEMWIWAVKRREGQIAHMEEIMRQQAHHVQSIEAEMAAHKLST